MKDFRQNTRGKERRAAVGSSVPQQILGGVSKPTGKMNGVRAKYIEGEGICFYMRDLAGCGPMLLHHGYFYLSVIAVG